MPDRRHHRGAHPEDARLFAPEAHDRLRSAVEDLAWLLSRDYAEPSALKVVGDRYELDARQRMAVMRATCSDQACDGRRAREIPVTALAGREIHVDGYNLLTTIEAALGGGVLLLCRDGALRDTASLHGSYRKVDETRPALELIGQTAHRLGITAMTWYLDSPVSNSGRLKTIIHEVAHQNAWTWTVQIVPDPDPLLSASPQIIVSADSVILDRCQQWTNLARHIVESAGVGNVVRMCV